MPNRTQTEILIAEMDRQGLVDNEMRAGLAAIIGGESGMQPVSEVGYRTTSNERIRSIFGSAKGMTDTELTALKADDAAFFEAMYGCHTNTGKQLGNTEPGDGYRFRGRGLIQLTGRGNYRRYAELTGHPELVEAPDLANDPAIAAAIAVAYFKDRYHGGGWPAMKRAFGNSFGAPDAVKNRLFAQYRASGEFSRNGPAPLPTISENSRGDAVRKLQRLLGLAGQPVTMDGIFGPRTAAAVLRFQARQGLVADGIVGPLTWAALGAYQTED